MTDAPLTVGDLLEGLQASLTAGRRTGGSRRHQLRARCGYGLPA